MAARRGGVSPECGVLAKREDYDPPNLVQQGDWKLGGAHWALDRRRDRRRGSDGADRRQNSTELGVRALQGVSRLLDSTGRSVKVLRGSHGGQRARSRTRGVELRRRTGSPPAASGANPKASWAGVAGAGLGKLAGAEAGIWRGLAGARLRRCGVAAAAHGALRSGAVRAWSCGAEVAAAG